MRKFFIILYLSLFRASDHFSNVVLRLVRNFDTIPDTLLWSNIIIHLVREVVSSVDPNVRNGDSLDIRPYVKIKIIPGIILMYYIALHWTLS